jgi:hypothetical protein
VGLTTSPPSVSRLSRKYGTLNISQPYWRSWPATGIALLSTPLNRSFNFYGKHSFTFLAVSSYLMLPLPFQLYNPVTETREKSIFRVISILPTPHILSTLLLYHILELKIRGLKLRYRSVSQWHYPHAMSCISTLIFYFIDYLKRINTDSAYRLRRIGCVSFLNNLEVQVIVHSGLLFHFQNIVLLL